MDILLQILKQHGLGVALAAAVGAVCWFLLRLLMSNYKEDRAIWKETIEAQQAIIGNHMNHLTDSNKEVVVKIDHHDSNSKRNSDEIVKAIEAQTSVLKAILSSDK